MGYVHIWRPNRNIAMRLLAASTSFLDPIQSYQNPWVGRYPPIIQHGMLKKITSFFKDFLIPTSIHPKNLIPTPRSTQISRSAWVPRHRWAPSSPVPGRPGPLFAWPQVQSRCAARSSPGPCSTGARWPGELMGGFTYGNWGLKP